MKKLAKIAIAAAFLISAGYAKENNSTKPDAASVSAAKELFETLHFKDNYKRMVDNATNVLVTRKPKLKKIEDKIRAFYTKYVGWKAMEPKLAKLYAKSFNADELKEINKFYKSKVGQKSLKVMPKLIIESQKMGMDIISKHADELNSLIKKTLEEKKKKEKKTEDKKETKDKK